VLIIFFLLQLFELSVQSFAKHSSLCESFGFDIDHDFIFDESCQSFPTRSPILASSCFGKHSVIITAVFFFLVCERLSA